MLSKRRQILAMMGLATISFLLGTSFNVTARNQYYSSPFSAVWEAIFGLQSQVDRLNASLIALEERVRALEPPGPELVGYWKFDEGTGTTTYDSSAHGNTGTLMNGPQWVEGVKGNALSFDGSDDYVRVPHSQSICVTGNEISIAFWLKPSETLDSSTIPFNCLDKGNEYTFQMSQSPQGPTPDGRLWFAVVLEPNPGFNWQGIQTMTNHWNAETWYHIVGTYDGSSIKIYVDGALENSKPLSGNLNAQGTYPLSIGSYTLGTMCFFKGAIDEVMIYNRALSVGEIETLYQQ